MHKTFGLGEEVDRKLCDAMSKFAFCPFEIGFRAWNQAIIFCRDFDDMIWPKTGKIEDWLADSNFDQVILETLPEIFGNVFREHRKAELHEDQKAPPMPFFRALMNIATNIMVSIKI